MQLCVGYQFLSLYFSIGCGDIFFKKAGSGCYRDDKSPPPLPELILTDRDSSSPVYSGKKVDYGNWDTYMPDLICRCAEKAFSLKKPIFGLEFYGNLSALINNLIRILVNFLVNR